MYQRSRIAFVAVPTAPLGQRPDGRIRLEVRRGQERRRRLPARSRRDQRRVEDRGPGSPLDHDQVVGAGAARHLGEDRLDDAVGRLGPREVAENPGHVLRRDAATPLARLDRVPAHELRGRDQRQQGKDHQVDGPFERREPDQHEDAEQGRERRQQPPETPDAPRERVRAVVLGSDATEEAHDPARMARSPRARQPSAQY